MEGTSALIVYSLEFCPNCEILKEYLGRHNILYTECDLSTAESLTELRVNGVFVNEAPVLRRGGVFLTSTEMFAGGKLREETVRKLTEGS